jgi:predicted metallo-beta-lactamase superfamily hydrolase
MISNHATLTAELLSYYLRIWQTPPAPMPSTEEIERLREQNWQRVNEITKWFYVASVSSFEYSAKKVVKDVQTEAAQKLRQELQRHKRLYLSSITRAAREVGLITDEQHQTWKGLIAVRNIVVHNNAVADATQQHKIGSLQIHFHKGEMLKGDLTFFVNLGETLVEQYRYWLEIVLHKTGCDLVRD